MQSRKNSAAWPDWDWSADSCWISLATDGCESMDRSDITRPYSEHWENDASNPTAQQWTTRHNHRHHIADAQWNIKSTPHSSEISVHLWLIFNKHIHKHIAQMRSIALQPCLHQLTHLATGRWQADDWCMTSTAARASTYGHEVESEQLLIYYEHDFVHLQCQCCSPAVLGE